MSSYDYLGSFVAVPLGYALSGPLASAFGLGPTLEVAGVVLIVSSIGASFIPSIRKLERIEPSADEAASESSTIDRRMTDEQNDGRTHLPLLLSTQGEQRREVTSCHPQYEPAALLDEDPAPRRHLLIEVLGKRADPEAGQGGGGHDLA